MAKVTSMTIPQQSLHAQGTTAALLDLSPSFFNPWGTPRGSPCVHRSAIASQEAILVTSVAGTVPVHPWAKLEGPSEKHPFFSKVGISYDIIVFRNLPRFVDYQRSSSLFT